jgi:hypothetical protein
VRRAGGLSWQAAALAANCTTASAAPHAADNARMQLLVTHIINLYLTISLIPISSTCQPSLRHGRLRGPQAARSTCSVTRAG